MVSGAPRFWALQVINTTGIVFAYNDRLPLKLDWDAVQPALSLSTFFLVFYGSSCYARFYELYGYCIEMSGATMEWVADVRCYFTDADLRWNLVRLLLLAMQLQYCLVDGDKKISEIQFSCMKLNHLVTGMCCSVRATTCSGTHQNSQPQSAGLTCVPRC